MDGRLRWSARWAGRLIAGVALPLLGAGACATTDSLGQMYTEGTTFEEYLPDAAENNELWRTNWEQSVVPDVVLEEFRAQEGSATPTVLLLDEDFEAARHGRSICPGMVDGSP